MRLGQTVGVLTAAVFLGVGCGDSADGDGEADRTLDGTWTVIEIDGQPIVPGENTETIPFLEIEAGKAVGSFGCDGGSASLRVDGDALDVVESGSEDGGCASVAV